MPLFGDILNQMSFVEVSDLKLRFNSSFHAADELHTLARLLIQPDSCKLAAALLGLMRAWIAV